MERSEFDAFIFDLDGVLVDTAKSHYKAWKRLADQLGVRFDEEINEGLKGVSRSECLDQILKLGQISKTEEEKKQLSELKNNWYLEFLNTLSESNSLPYARDFLQHLKDNKMKIALGSSSKNAVRVLEKTNLKHFFDVIVDGNRTVNTKPDPEVFIKAANELDVKPAHCIVFEDSQRGIQAANKGGFISVGIGNPAILKEAIEVISSFEGKSIQSFKALLERV